MMFEVQVIESESGWGQRVDEVRTFPTYEAAAQFRNKFNAKNNESVVPEWYMYATDPVEIK